MSKHGTVCECVVFCVVFGVFENRKTIKAKKNMEAPNLSKCFAPGMCGFQQDGLVGVKFCKKNLNRALRFLLRQECALKNWIPHVMRQTAHCMRVSKTG